MKSYMDQLFDDLKGFKAQGKPPRDIMAYVPQHGTEEEMAEQRKKVEDLLPGVKVLTNEEWEEQNTL